ncbi:hypothetical protein H6P81_019152 [Aristolochia fimbriata]|uniref:Transglycosylase SLT domain-containing protein n=1 Tax=Aristolochia fimbriata TaxID=158543 RepID=A0AAV7DUL3_ARIFI|nr:hypothetical protein H6P81_019152 [Aristolochia fimbriata]
MAIIFKYWDDCVEPEDLEAMWADPEVSQEWIDAGETKGQKILLSRDPDGQPFLTQTEMRAVAEITVSRHFNSKIDPDMLRALAEIASDRQPLCSRYDKKTKETSIGLMQITPAIATKILKETDCRAYEIQASQSALNRPFVNTYMGAAYLKWLSTFEGTERDEEFVIRAYKGNIKKPKKAYHKSTLDFWNRYLSVKKSLPSRRNTNDRESETVESDSSDSDGPAAPKADNQLKYWDSVVSQEDMDELWKRPSVQKEWTKSGEKRGRVRFPLDPKGRPYLSLAEVKAIAEIVVSKHFTMKQMAPAVLCALAELSSMRFVNGVGARKGLMGIDYPTAVWLHRDGYNAYQAKSEVDLSNPFLSMYFGAAYLVWLSNYEGRPRAPEFIAEAYIAGPENVKPDEASILLLKFQDALSLYDDPKTVQKHCSIL